MNETAQRTIWQSGWRPAIGWVCAAAFATVFIFQPLWVMLATGAVPATETGPLVTVTTALIGLGGLRTYEKLKGVSK